MNNLTKQICEVGVYHVFSMRIAMVRAIPMIGDCPGWVLYCEIMARNVFNFLVLVNYILTDRSGILTVVTKNFLCGHIYCKGQKYFY
jgi:hypothetical protein